MGSLSIGRIAAALGAVLALLGAVYAAAFLDWHQFGDATPPESIPKVQSAEAQLLEFLVNSTDAMQSEAQFEGDSRIEVQGIVKLKPVDWRWSQGFLHGLASSERLAHARERARLPVPELRIDLVCRARNEAGERVVSRGLCFLNWEGEENVGWATNFIVTPRPGTYHIRIWLCKRFPEQPRSLEPEKLLLGSFRVHVVTE